MCRWLPPLGHAALARLPVVRFIRMGRATAWFAALHIAHESGAAHGRARQRGRRDFTALPHSRSPIGA
jgi:hypothetical protein